MEELENQDLQNEQPETTKNVFFEWAEAMVYAIVAVIFVFTFIVRIVSVDGISMLPTLEDGDKLIISNLAYDPEYKDIVVISKDSFEQGKPIIKRVIATEGQIVDINFGTGEVFVDGEVLEENYINETTRLEGDMDFPVVVSHNQIFVMGDNRNHSTDSRVSTVGVVDEECILGRVILRVFPFDSFGKVE